MIFAVKGCAIRACGFMLAIVAEAPAVVGDFDPPVPSTSHTTIATGTRTASAMPIRAAGRIPSSSNLRTGGRTGGMRPLTS